MQHVNVHHTSRPSTGYTGRLTAEYIVKALPIDLKWAVGGRSKSKLNALVRDLAALRPERPMPSILTASLAGEDMDSLTKRTRLVISTVGPFQHYGSITFRACARNGTHYVDSTAETFWVADMIRLHDATARENGSVMIPCCGFDCVPSDISTWLAVSHIRRQSSLPTARVDTCIHSIQGSVSGGTLASFIQAFDTYSFRQLYRIHAPFALAPLRSERTLPERRTGMWSKVLGLLKIKELGWMAYQPQGPIDRAIVHRTWGLLQGTGESYDENFEFHAWLRVWGPISAVLWHFMFVGLTVLFPVRPVRWALGKMWYQPGDKVKDEKATENWLEYRTIAEADVRDQNEETASATAAATMMQGKKRKLKALVRIRYDSDPYIFTAVTMAEAAMVILRDTDTQAHMLGGGVLTSATLGDRYISRLRAAGLVLEARDRDPRKEKKEVWGSH